MWKKVLKIVVGALGVVLIAGAAYAGIVIYRFDASMERVYEIPLPPLAASADPAQIERGRHLAESVGGCSSGECHGNALSGGTTIEVGPLGSFTAPNLTPGSAVAVASDGEIARTILHGVGRDGRSLRFMPAHEINWLPDEDLVALLSYIRSVPSVAKADGPIEIGLLGKLLDRHDKIVLDVARRIDHGRRETAPAPAPTALYGAFLARTCVGCHGEHLSGGRIPGAPPEMAIPLNITPDATGIRDWSFTDFEHMLATGLRPDGRKLDPMMPVQALNAMNETEKSALWEFLRSQPARPFGGR
jgi:mono/diheme cytochrome c family protein